MTAPVQAAPAPSAPASAAPAAPARKAPFVAQLRRRPESLRLAAPGAVVLSLRVSVPELWDTLLVEVAPSVSVIEVKRAVLAELLPDAPPPEDFVCKLHGFEILDETQSVTEAGVRDGSTILLTYRRRRPVR